MVRAAAPSCRARCSTSTTTAAQTLGSGITTATRPFDAPLTVGGTFQFSDVLNNGNGGTSALGFSLDDSAGTPLFSMYATGGGGYTIVDTSGTHSAIGLTYNYHSTDTFAFTPSDAAGDYSLAVTQGTATPLTYTGTLIPGASAPDAAAIFNNDGRRQRRAVQQPVDHRRAGADVCGEGNCGGRRAGFTPPTCLRRI